MEGVWAMGCGERTFLGTTLTFISPPPDMARLRPREATEADDRRAGSWGTARAQGAKGGQGIRRGEDRKEEGTDGARGGWAWYWR